jgi:Rod binding domain-containing protein
VKTEVEDAPIVESKMDNAAAAASVKMTDAERGALVSKTAGRLAAAFGDDDSPAPTTTKKPAPKAKAQVEEETTEEETETEEAATEAAAESEEKETAETEEEATDETEEAAASDDGAPTLPDSYRRSLKSYGWGDKEIDKNLKLLGADFINTAAKIHANRNEEVSRWADAGRAARQQTHTTAQETVGLQPLKALDVKALEDHYGKDEMVKEIAGPVNAMIQQINAMLPLITASQTNAQQAEIEKLSQQIEGFFGDKKLESMREFIGDSSGLKPLTESQQKVRNTILEMADALVLGAKGQGRKLNLNEALQHSLDSVSGEFKEQGIRKTIKKTMQKREKGISLQPSGRSKAALAATGPKTRTQLEKDTRSRLRAVFA